MFLVKAGTVIQVEIPKSERGHFNWVGWRPYTTKEDKIYDKHEVWDAVSVHNDGWEIPAWIVRNVTEHGNVVIKRAGKYAMCKPAQIEFLD
jgi:hypothetical protein